MPVMCDNGGSEDGCILYKPSDVHQAPSFSAEKRGMFGFGE
jgi:hypothetical protein